MNEPGVLLTVASIVVAYAVTVLIFRLQRELRMREQGERTWVALADWLPIVAFLIAVLFVALPVLAVDPALRGPLPRAAAMLSLVLCLGWIPAILAHYRLLFGAHRTGPRRNPEPLEAVFVLASGLMGLVGFFLFYAGIPSYRA